jgi:hypothetical protein
MYGYIVEVSNPNFSGLATVKIAEKPNARETRDPGTLTTAYVEAGFGVRQLVSYFGSWDAMVERAPTTRLWFELEGPMITSFHGGRK